MAEKENKKPIDKINTKKCTVLSNTLKDTIIEFDGNGILVEGIFEKQVEVKYKGKIGNKNFKIISYK